MPFDFLADPRKPRDIPPQNIVHRLVARELYGISYHRCAVDRNRSFYSNVVPNYSLVNVEKPPCYLRKFTPDGKRFITFSQCQTQLEIYAYKGPAAFNDVVSQCPPGNYLPIVDNAFNNNVRRSAFEAFFSLEQTITLCSLGIEQLNRECSLFSDDGDFVIVGSASYSTRADFHPQMWELHQNNESVAPNPKLPLENYTLYSIDIAEGILADKVEFKVDKIFLAHNQGVYLFKNVLAVLSVQHQTIHIFKYYNGDFIPVMRVGRLVYPDDDLALFNTFTAEGQSTSSTDKRSRQVYREYREQTINCLKHRLLVFLFRRAQKLSEIDNSLLEIRRFYQHFDQLRALRIWKMQLLDEHHFLLKYATEEVVTLRTSEPNSHLSFFVVYNYVTTEVIAVYDNTSQELVDLLEHYCDFFRNTSLNPDFSVEELRYYQQAPSMSNNIYARLSMERFRQTIISAKNGGVLEAKKRVLSQLPISAQSYSCSPYLDLSLFSYDEKWVSPMERPKASGDTPILFYDRHRGKLKFAMYAGMQGRSGNQQASQQRKLVAFIFHPTDPFVISVQKSQLNYIVNFHVRRARS